MALVAGVFIVAPDVRMSILAMGSPMRPYTLTQTDQSFSKSPLQTGRAIRFLWRSDCLALFLEGERAKARVTFTSAEHCPPGGNARAVALRARWNCDSYYNQTGN